MTEDLPITIHVDATLSTRYTAINSIKNKLEAELNFHALRANWFGDEENILHIQLILEPAKAFHDNKIAREALASNTVLISFLSDDVLNYFSSQALLCKSYIALTESEDKLLTQQPKLLPGLLQVKLRKIVNLIAVAQNFTPI